MPSLRHLRSFVAVCEEGSFTRAAQRENATQSGISQHIAALEAELGTPLFDRQPGGALPTPAGEIYLRHATRALAALDSGRAEVLGLKGALAGPVRAGLMPSFTRAALAPVLQRFGLNHPNVRPEIIEGYSGALTDLVRMGGLDFALVPAGGAMTGLRQTPLARDREMLVCRPGRIALPHGAPLPHGTPVRLAALGPLRVALPGRANARRPRLEAYFAAQNVPLAEVLEIDSMLGTLELVAQSDWVAILPGVICAGDADGRARHVHPLTDPGLSADFVTVEPARGALSPAAAAFLAEMRAEILRLIRFDPGSGAGSGAPA
jgi:LysR family transcriptional regulator, nitrogen assimilation regulatory protein